MVKNSIVIVNSYNVMRGGTGTKGNSPVNFVMDYMSRSGAVENLPPVLKVGDNALSVQYERVSGQNNRFSSSEWTRGYRVSDGLGGVAFGDGNVTLSHEELVKKAQAIQHCFENGKTVLMTVVSFDTKYLKEHHLVNLDHDNDRLMGKVDHGRLRDALVCGVQSLSRNYEDLHWIGVIQTDTEHVHCHLCMVDAGEARMVGDEQKGKLTKKDMDRFRMGIDHAVSRSDAYHFMPSSYVYEKQDQRAVLEQKIAEELHQQNLLVQISSLLPEDRSQWNAQSNHAGTQKIQEFLTDLLEKDGTYQNVLLQIRNEAYRKWPHHSKNADREFQRGKDELMNRCIDTVYESIAQKASDSVKHSYFVRRMTEHVSASEPEDACIRFRRRCGAKKYHREQAEKAHQNVKIMKKEVENRPVMRPVLDFWTFEEEYQLKLHEKYRLLFRIQTEKAKSQRLYQKIQEQAKLMAKFNQMMKNSALKGMAPEQAEQCGRKWYGFHGGRYVSSQSARPDYLEARKKQMLYQYMDVRNEFDFYGKLEGYGMDDKYRLCRKDAYAFDDVKVLDLHHLTASRLQEDVSEPLKKQFETVRKQRERLAEAAEDVLPGSVTVSVKKDIQRMREIPGSAGSELPQREPVLSRDLYESVKKNVNECVMSFM